MCLLQILILTHLRSASAEGYQFNYLLITADPNSQPLVFVCRVALADGYQLNYSLISRIYVLRWYHEVNKMKKLQPAKTRKLRGAKLLHWALVGEDISSLATDICNTAGAKFAILPDFCSPMDRFMPEFFMFAHSLGLQLCVFLWNPFRKKKVELKKTVISQSLRLAVLRCIPHLLPVS